MGSFAQLLMIMESQNNLEGDNSSSDDTPAMQVIRTGLNINEDFWDDFIRITNNPDALSDLLGVRPELISGWANVINENLDKVRKADASGGGDDETKTTVMDTGRSSLDPSSLQGQQI